ncbi:hypothetical protein C2G38_2234456 [Gigaspora rosea]|uniref:Uncharacterized protein n=1 Tax=Gigaspora rosea TaxID=44941 RepID=A0A397TUM1_9GLOM|nr:hypothetical protein C2G38_2234456 [Gigaspora rosea]
MTIKHFEKLSNNHIEFLGKGIDFNVIIKKLSKDVDNIINLESHISIQQFEIIIKGTVSLENFDNQFIFDLIFVADEFLFEESVGHLKLIYCLPPI